MKEGIASKVEALAAPVAEELGYTLFDVEYVKEGPDYFLRLYITSGSGITIDDCEAMSRAVDPLLDEADFIKDRYYLEVSSVGLDRPLKKEKDFQRNLGEEVEVRTFRAIDGQKEFTGVLKAYDKESVTIELEETEMKFARTDIALIRQAFDF